MSDLLLDAAQAYIKLMNFTYEVKIRVSKDIATINIDFRKDNFRHLAGIDKLKDLFSKEHISSENFLDMVLEEKFSYSDVLRSSYINEPINSPDKDGVSYYLPDRLKALCNLQNCLCNASPQSLSVHRWLSNAPKNLRPHQSNISADYLFTFRSAPCNKSSTEQVHSFFIESCSVSHFSGVSIFPSDKSYSDDGKIKMDEYPLLSVTEINKSSHDKNIIFEVTSDELARIEKQVKLEKTYSIISNDIKSLKINRRKAIESPSEKTQSKYEKQLSIFKNRNIYSEDMLKEVINRLNAQLSDVKDEKSAEMIKSEIKVVQDELDERMRSPSQQIKDISISTTQANPDGTLSIKPIVSVPIPKAVTDIPKVVQRSTHTMTGSVKSFLSDIANKLNKHFAPKPPRTPSRASQSKSKDNSSKKVKNVKKERPVAPVKHSAQKQEHRSSVLAELKTIKAEQQAQDKPERSHQHRKTKSNDREI